MSVKAMNWAFSLDVRPAGLKLLLITIADGANQDAELWHGQKTLAEMTSMSERAVREHLKTLEDMGLISRKERRRADGSRTSDLIAINIDAETAPDQPAEVAGDLLAPTGNSRQTNRQLLPNSPAKSAGPNMNPKVNPKRNRSDTNVSDAGASSGEERVTPEDEFWTYAIGLVNMGMTDSQARGMMGRLQNNVDGDHERGMKVLDQAMSKRDPKSYLAAAINQIRERNKAEGEWRDDMAI